MGSINYFQAVRPDTAYLKKIIETSLLSDWAISIEYQTRESETTCWQLWDKTFFAIRSAEHVLTALLNCYTRHPKSTIRIYAEKFRPQSRILYTVYDPHFLPAESAVNLQTPASLSPRDHERPSTPLGLIA